MATTDDLESYLLRLDRRFEVEGGTYIVSTGPGQPPVAIRVAEPVAVVRLSVGQVPEEGARQARLFRRMLEFNASDLLHTAYGLDGTQLVLSAGLELATLDINELEATLSDVDLALARHIPELREIAQGAR